MGLVEHVVLLCLSDLFCPNSSPGCLGAARGTLVDAATPPCCCWGGSKAECKLV